MEQLDLFSYRPDPSGARTMAVKPAAAAKAWARPAAKAPASARRAQPPEKVNPEARTPAPIAGKFQWAQIIPAALKKPLRDYQEKMRAAIHAHFPTASRALEVAATGAGKTVLFAAATADVVAAGGRVLILTDQQDLVDQAIEKIFTVAGLYAAAEQGSRVASPSAMVVVATPQTLVGDRLQKWPRDHFALIVCDECDRAMAEMWQKVLRHFDKTARVLGVTATPKRSDRKDILKYFETKIAEVSLLELIDRKFLVPINVREMNVTIDLRKVEQETKSGDYDPEAVASAVEGIFEDVWREWHKEAGDLKTIVFCPDVETSKKFMLEGQRQGRNVRHIDGTTPNRKELLKGFQEWSLGSRDPKHFQIATNPFFLGRGFDCPSIGCIINLRVTQSISSYQQFIGRGTRLFCPRGCGGPCDHPERKMELLVLDFLYQFKELGPCRPAHLFSDSPEKIAEMQRIISASQGKLDLRDVANQAKANMEAALVKALQDAQRKHRGKKGEYYSAMSFAAALKMPDFVDYVPETDAEAAPVKEKIRKQLSNLGFIPESIPFMGLAKRIIATCKARKAAGLASAKQVFWLMRWGYRNPWDFTSKRASQIMNERFAR